MTQRDFHDAGCKQNLEQSLAAIMDVGMVPIVNENDAVSGNAGYGNVPAGCFSDNELEAAYVRREWRRTTSTFAVEGGRTRQRDVHDLHRVVGVDRGARHYEPVRVRTYCIRVCAYCVGVLCGRVVF